jgi:acylphosphatase
VIFSFDEKNMANEHVSKRVIYHGRVQGVGFRYTTRGIAKRFRISGFVRNLSDGTVELLTQGEPDEVCRFLAAVGESLAANISHVEESDATPDAGFTRFEIRH